MSSFHPDFQTYSISKEIHTQLQSVHKLLDLINKRPKPTVDGMFKILNAISEEMPKLFTILSTCFAKSENKAAEAMKINFKFPGSEKEAPLFVILAYAYYQIIEIQKDRGYLLITDDRHLKYAAKVMQLHQSGIGSFI